MKLTDLVLAAADPRVNPRFVRFLVAADIIPPPTGGRAHAVYGPDHLTGIRRYLRLRDLGLSMAAIKRLDAGVLPEALAVDLAPGLSLAIRPAELGELPDAAVLAARIADAVADITRAPSPARTIHGASTGADTKRTR